MKKLKTILLFLSFCQLCSCQENDRRYYNLDFENISPNLNFPDFWYIWPESRGFRFQIDSVEKNKGNYSLLIEPDGTKEDRTYGAVAITLPVTPKGKEIELKGFMKLEGVSEGSAGFFLRIDGESGPLQFDNMLERNIRGSVDWSQYTVRLPLPENSKTIYVGALLAGNGRLWIDDFQLFIDGKELHEVIEVIEDPVFEKYPFPSEALLSDSTSAVGKVPLKYGFDPFYKKYLNARGIPIVSSQKVSDAAFYRARNTILYMLERLPEVRLKIIENNVRVAIIAPDELTTTIPEHSDLNRAFPETNWDARARGLSATLIRPATSCGEENLLCFQNDPYKGQDILVHEFAHTIQALGISLLDSNFNTQLTEIYYEAKEKGLWKNTYAISDPSEYFAEGVQCWFDVNSESIPNNGINNEINTREELKHYDPKLYALLSKYFSDDSRKFSCHQSEKEAWQ